MKANQSKILHHTAFIVLFLAISALSSIVYAQDMDDFEEDDFFTKPLSTFGNLPERYSRQVRRKVYYSTENGVDYNHDIDYIARLFLNRAGNLSGLSGLHFNRVDGLTLGFHSATQDFSYIEDLYGFAISGGLAWSFGQDRVLWQFAAEQHIYERIIIGAEWHDHTTSADLWKVGPTESSLTAFFSGFDYMNYFTAKGFSTYITTKPWFVQASLGYHWNRFSSLPLQTRYSMFGGKSVVRENPAIDEGKVQNLSAVININPRGRWFGDVLQVKASLLTEYGDDSAFSLSDYRFNRHIAHSKFLLKLDRARTLSWRGLAYAVSSSENNIPTQFLANAGGIGTVMAHPLGALNGTHMLVSNLEFNIFNQRGYYSSRVGKNYDGSWDNFGFDVDLSSPEVGVFWDMGWSGFATAERSTNPFSGFSDNRGGQVLHTVGAVISAGSLQFRVGWDPDDFNERPVFLIRLNPRF